MMKAIFLMLSVSMLSLQQSIGQGQSDWKAPFKEISDEVLAHSEAYTRLGQSVEQIGHRLSGSPQGTRAEEYAFDLLKSYGFTDVSFQPFALNSWIRGSLDVQVGGKEGVRPVRATALAQTPVAVSVEGELIDMGNGLHDDYAAASEKVKGKIVLAALNLLPNSPKQTVNLHRSAKAALAIRYGAKGIIFFNNMRGGTLVTGTTSMDGELISIPAVCIGLEDGMEIKKQIANGWTRSVINMQNTVGKAQARNVIARLKGKELPDEKIVVGAHLDSWDLAVGAVDNGLGAFSVIDMARTFIKLGIQPRRTIEFVLFMGEEQGMLGSNAYLRHAEEVGSLDQIRFMLNFDMTNDPKSFKASTAAVKDLFEQMASTVSTIDTTFRTGFGTRASLYSDHQPFMLKGIPIGWVRDNHLSPEARSCYHTELDRYELVNEKEMKNTVRFGSMLIYGLADAPHISVQRLTDAQTIQLLRDNGLEEPLRLNGGWIWN